MGIKQVSIIFILFLAVPVFYSAYGLSDEELKYRVNENHKESGPLQLQNVDNENDGKPEFGINGVQTVSKSDMYSNSRFAPYDNQSGTITFALPSYWDDPFLSCHVIFKCITDNTTGWKNGTSFQISTTNNTNNTWSRIRGKEIHVKPKEGYELVTHMKLNEWAWGSHIVLERFNLSSKQWYKIKQRPLVSMGLCLGKSSAAQ